LSEQVSPGACAGGHLEKEPFVQNLGGLPSQVPEGFVFDLLDILPAASRLKPGAEVNQANFDKVAAAVTKLMKRSEWTEASYEAIRKEASGLLESGTWIEDSVTDKHILLAKTRGDGSRIHLGDLLTLCSIKFSERQPEFWKFKGRICFRGDNVKDETGAAAVFQDLNAAPTAIQAVNANMAYGCFPGNKSTTCDAVRAYVQALLKSKHKTWVRIPKELWPPSWKGRFTAPMCLLDKALYGHPESGAHWEIHLTEAITAMGGVAIAEHPSNFWFAAEGLLLTVYVDDLLLSGPADNHDCFWEKLRTGAFPIACDEPEPLTRFLGRDHIYEASVRE